MTEELTHSNYKSSRHLKKKNQNLPVLLLKDKPLINFTVAPSSFF